MKKSEIIVPGGIRFISEIQNFSLPNHPCIIDKGLTGCGFTQFCITNSENVILCSPRKMLLENKEQQNPNVLYVRNECEFVLQTDRDLNIFERRLTEDILIDPEVAKSQHVLLKDQIKHFYSKCLMTNTPCKLLVTYDSFRIVKEALQDLGSLDFFNVVIDEFQSIFVDSRFKSTTEMGFLNHLEGIQKKCFVSATPMIESYLDRMDEFKNLPYYEMNWDKEDPLRVMKPLLDVRSVGQHSVNVVAKKFIIQPYLDGNFEKTIINTKDGLIEVESKEAVIYVNSVKNIIDIIKFCKLKPEQCNILCANTNENKKRIEKRLKSKLYQIGSIPLQEESHKMFTFCTRTVYLGADFYSDNARTFILSDANIECLAVDITLDLPQILGRQRLEINPWKTKAMLFVKFLNKDKKKTRELLDELMNKKMDSTHALLGLYEKGTSFEKSTVTYKYEKDALNSSYRDDYVAVDKHLSSIPLPVFNRLVMLADERAFEIQQIDYADRFRVFTALRNVVNTAESSIRTIDFIEKYNSDSKEFTDRMKLLCDFGFTSEELEVVFKQIPTEYAKYYYALGPKKIKAKMYKKCLLEDEYKKIAFGEVELSLQTLIYDNFKVGDTWILLNIKNLIGDLYKQVKLENKYPRAIDLLDYFEVKKVKTYDKITKKRFNGYKLIKKLK